MLYEHLYGEMNHALQLDYPEDMRYFYWSEDRL